MVLSIGNCECERAPCVENANVVSSLPSVSVSAVTAASSGASLRSGTPVALRRVLPSARLVLLTADGLCAVSAWDEDVVDRKSVV